MNLAERWKALSALFISRRTGDRDAALDAFKGLAIIGMILVNHMPPTDHIYAPFTHSAWHGWTLADTIFPGFLVAVGVSIAFAMSDAAGRVVPPSGALYARIGRRTLLLVVVSLVLVNFPYYEIDKPRLAGVLSQIAFCYLVGALLFLHVRWRTQLAVLVALLAANYAWLALVDVPGSGRGALTPEGSAARYLDHLVLGRYARAFETGESSPYGLLVHLSSLGSMLIGLLAGQWLRSKRDPALRLAGLFAAGFLLVTLGVAFDSTLPINKLLWTASFVLFTGGIALQTLASMYWIIDVLRRGWITLPLQIAGMNALFFYVLAQSAQRVLVYGRFNDGAGSRVRLRDYLYQTFFVPLDAGKFGALLYTLCFLLACYAVIAYLYRRRILIKL